MDRGGDNVVSNESVSPQRERVDLSVGALVQREDAIYRITERCSTSSRSSVSRSSRGGRRRRRASGFASLSGPRHDFPIARCR